MVTLNPRGKNIVVTGAAGDIGAAVCRQLYASGDHVHIVGLDRDRDGLAALNVSIDRSDRIRDRGEFWPAELYLTDPIAVGKLKKILEQFLGAAGKLDAVICVAGAANDCRGDFPAEHEFEWAFRANFMTAAKTVDATLPFVRRGAGAFVFTSSVNAILGIGEIPYSSAKAALTPLARCLATQFGHEGVRANALALGTIATKIWSRRVKKDPEVLNKIAARNPRGRVGTAEEAARVLCFLASPASALINGQVIIADGGWSIAAGTITNDPSKPWYDM